ncbi:MAG: aldo/keto reductase [Agathobacter sp.]|nr:aldo/keto reductase [Agathobacter sp.]
MQYRTDKYGNKLSVLGYGCMRFTKNAGVIDMDKAEKELMAAYEMGINYYDTAYIYGGSEAAIGKIFEKNGIRENINIATKLPHYLMHSMESIEKCFQEELSRLRTDYIDYYLMHMLNDVKTWKKLVDMGILEWIREKKESGAIRQIGFSYHGNSDMFCQVVDAYDWDFCQIQYNYLDEHAQAGRKGLHHAASKGIPVIIMEPLRGGKLVNNLPEKAKKLFAEHPKNYSPAEWAFRWLWNQPEVTCVLSGMNSMEMLEENVRVASECQIGEFTESDNDLLAQIVEAINSKMKVGCTGCGYCLPCPMKVDIPGTFAAYNVSSIDGRREAMYEYLRSTTFRKDATSASNCIGCGKCEQHCPQGIQIREELKNAQKVLEGPIYKIAKKVVPLFIRY